MISRTDTIKNFWIIFFAVAALLAIATAVATSYIATETVSHTRMSVIDDDNTYKVSQENSYKQALYLACDSMKNLDANLGKISVSSDRAHQAKMLSGVVIHANMVNQSLASLPFADSENLAQVNKFVNQTQDYATHLLSKMASGEELTAEERMALSNLDNVAKATYDFLQEYAESDAGMFMTNGNGANNEGALSSSLGDMDENAFSYEKLIYDGPFSDSVDDETLPTVNKISHDAGSKIVADLFGENKFVQELNNKGLTYVYELKNGRVILSADGRVVQYETYCEQSAENGGQCKEKCIAVAEEFCQKLGFDVKGVWISKTQDYVTYVNCAPVVDDVIVYPELIKVAVDAEGKVCGVEARAYVTNHKERDVKFGTVSEEKAKQAIDKTLTITNVAKALIEKNDKTHLCYEFECKKGDRQYYVYVDSQNGAEVEIFKVIQNTEGFTVM